MYIQEFFLGFSNDKLSLYQIVHVNSNNNKSWTKVTSRVRAIEQDCVLVSPYRTNRV